MANVDHNKKLELELEVVKFLEFDGVVEEALPAAMFKIKVNGSDNFVLCTLAGKLRKNRIRILVGDRVKIEVSPYDLSRGRVVWRK